MTNFSKRTNNRGKNVTQIPQLKSSEITNQKVPINKGEITKKIPTDINKTTS